MLATGLDSSIVLDVGVVLEVVQAQGGPHGTGDAAWPALLVRTISPASRKRSFSASLSPTALAARAEAAAFEPHGRRAGGHQQLQRSDPSPHVASCIRSTEVPADYRPPARSVGPCRQAELGLPGRLPEQRVGVFEAKVQLGLSSRSPSVPTA